MRLVQRTAYAEALLEVWLAEVRGGRQEAPSHPNGVLEQLMVLDGWLTAGPVHSPVDLGAGDYLSFAADQPHVYRVPEDGSARMLMIMVYPAGVGGRGMISHDLPDPIPDSRGQASAGRPVPTEVERLTP